VSKDTLKLGAFNPIGELIQHFEIVFVYNDLSVGKCLPYVSAKGTKCLLDEMKNVIAAAEKNTRTAVCRKTWNKSGSKKPRRA
jgi:hypothetical protein